MEQQKHKVIIDTDPGVDDATALILSMFDERLDIKLFTTVKGNIQVNLATRNMLHLLDKFGKSYPVAKGAAKGLKRNTPDATWLHGKFGLGHVYIAPAPKQKIIKKSAWNAMYDVIMENPGEVTILEFSPHTNIARLIQEHPDCIPYVKGIICEGFSSYGMPGVTPHISFNVSTDPEAFKVVIDSGIPLTIIPSETGRNITHFTERQVKKIGRMHETGKFLELIFQGYWEHGYKDKRIATNDSLAYMYLVEPEMFKYEMVDIAIDLNDVPGKTWATISSNGQFKLITDCNRKKFMKSIFKKLKALKGIKFEDKKEK